MKVSGVGWGGKRRRRKCTFRLVRPRFRVLSSAYGRPISTGFLTAEAERTRDRGPARAPNSEGSAGVRREGVATLIPRRILPCFWYAMFGMLVSFFISPSVKRESSVHVPAMRGPPRNPPSSASKSLVCLAAGWKSWRGNSAYPPPTVPIQSAMQ